MQNVNDSLWLFHVTRKNKYYHMKTDYSSISRAACTIFIACIYSVSNAQVTETFSDGNFTENPSWTGDIAHFEINSLHQLHLSSSGSDTAVLATQNYRVKNTEWNFWMKLSFNTSANNYARFYLTADTMALHSNVNGFFLQAGGADDSIYIMRQKGAIIEKLFSVKSYKTNHSTNIIRFKITCDEHGAWEMSMDTTGGYSYFTEGTFWDSTHFSSRWCGVYCKYTSSNATKIYFDDFYIGSIIQDSIHPTVVAHEVVSGTTIQVSFSETIQRDAAENPANYLLNSTGTFPDSVELDMQQSSRVVLHFQEAMQEATLDSLRIRNMVDLSGNLMPDTMVQVCFYHPGAYDILINEIMADPDPPVALPNGEYVELFNRTKFPVNLRDWSLKFRNNTKTLPPLTIQSQDYLLIAKDSAYLNYANCALVLTSASSLSNEGTSLALYDAHHHVIHAVSYTPDWFDGSFKEKGGWSLEMTDPGNPCGCSDNWKASKDAMGGTPGKINAAIKSNPDLDPPVLSRAVISDSSSLKVTFSESMDSISMLSTSNWIISPGNNYPVRVIPVSPGFTTAELLCNGVFTGGNTYRLRVSENLKDCAGNFCDSAIAIRFAIPDTVSGHDIIVNEVLSNPASGGSRFIELYNRSERVINLQSLVLSNSDSAAGLLPGAMPIIPEGYLLFPGDYIAVTTDRENILENYYSPSPENIIRMDGFPVFGDDSGTVIIARQDNLEVIDRMQYGPDMHYPLLVSREGVSLERAHPDMPSGDKNNWHSAAETAGFATPAFQNSHWVFPGAANHEISIEPEIFSPDNDGYNDLLTVIIRPKDQVYAVNISVYDARGRFIRQLANNVLAGSEAFFVWDGMTASGSKAPIGIYVIVIEIIVPDGTVSRTKRTAILGGRF